MTSRMFYSTHEFDNKWEQMGFDDDNLALLQYNILSNPKGGKLIRGTGGLRKLRCASENQGKSRCARVLYLDFESHGRVYLVSAFSKNMKENITASEREALKKLVCQAKKELEAV